MNHFTFADITARLDWVLASPKQQGRVESLVVRPSVNERQMVASALFSPAQGVAGDNWHSHCWKKLANGKSDPEVQVAIMNARMIEALTQDTTRWPLAGDQLFVDFDLSVDNLATGDQLQIGPVVLQITAEPHRGCGKFKQRFGEAALQLVNSQQGDAHRFRGVYAKILTLGEVHVGDSIAKL